MFEDSTFESACRIHTRSRQWMVAAFALNSSILLAFVVIPLIFPPMLQPLVKSFLTEVFTPPKPQPPQAQPVRTTVTHLEYDGTLTAPPTIPRTIFVPSEVEPPIDVSIFGPNSGLPNAPDQPFSGPSTRPVVRSGVTGPLRISAPVEEGRLILKTMPVYPAIARAAGISGTVMLAAIISKAGTIENLRIISGPMMLRQAAQDAVQTWRYRPYLLDGQPVEVETTVSVIFTLQR
jgi:protein TonB